MPKPNFFIAGAPKCGTTSLYDWLRDHPQVFLPSTKEPHFFADRRPGRVVQTEAQYEALFREADPSRHRAIGEASTTYLHTPGALENLRDYAPNAKIVIALRDPVEMVQSMHGHNLFQGTEDVEDFAQAWALSDERREGRMMPRSSKVVDPFQHVYADMGLLGTRTRRLMEIYPPDSVMVVFFEDLKEKPGDVYQQLETFLGLEHFERASFESKNVSKGHSLVTRIATGVPDPVLNAFRKLGISNTGLVDRVVSRFGKTQAKLPIEPSLVDEMRRFYRADIELLQRMTQRDLSRWLGSLP